MKNRLKYPLSLFVVWHPAFAKGKDIANDLYSSFCRNIEEPLARGLGIQVYYRSASLIPIDRNIASRNAIILLIDENYMIDVGFQEYTKQLVGLTDDNTRIYPIALCKQATGIGCGLESIQFIRYQDGFINIQDEYEKGIKKIKSELLHDCARLLMNFQPVWMDKKGSKIPSPVKLFLSHAKKDGEETTKKFKLFVESETKLDVFFDTVDIADGYDFEKQIEANIENAALVVFHTDEYSSREWCRIEVLVAKRNKCSIVVVHDIKDGEKRAFPYMGNTPTITLKEDESSSFIEILTLTLYQVVNNLYQKELLQSFEAEFKDEQAEFVTITSPPELFNYIDLYKMKLTEKKKLIVLYPEPPLGAEELRILNDLDKDIRFVTPIYLPTNIINMEAEKNISGISENLADSIAEQKELEVKSRQKGILDGMRIAVSVSENEDLEHLGLSIQHLKDVMIELARYLMANGGTLLYGGHLKNEGYTKLFAELSYQYKFLNDKSFRFVNYFPFPNSNSLTLEIKADFVKQQVEPVIIEIPKHLGEIDVSRHYDSVNIIEDKFIYSECFSDMRNIMAQNSHARIVVGGKQSRFLGYMPGIVEEAYYSLKANKPVYIVGGFGGAAKSLSKVICGEVPNELTNEFQYNDEILQNFKKEFQDKASVPMDYDKLIHFFKQFNLEVFSELNGLSIDENLVLFESQNIHEIVFLIMKGLKTISKNN